MDDVTLTESYIREANLRLRGIDYNIARLVDELRMTRQQNSRSPRPEETTSDQAAGGVELVPDDEDGQGDEVREENYVPEARQCNLVTYRELVKGETRHVLDFLVAGTELDSEISLWEDRNSAILSFNSTDAKNKENQDSKTHTRSKQPHATATNTVPKCSAEDGWIHCIRINSPIVIRMLRQLSEDEQITMHQRFEQQPLEFNRPFSFLIHHHKKMMIRLEELQKQVESQEIPLDSPLASCNQQAALKQLQCYFEFVKGRLIPEINKWRKTTEPKQQQPRIRFPDLWYLFQLGDLVYYPEPPFSLPGVTSGKVLPTFQSIARVHALSQPIKKDTRGGISGLTYNPVALHPTPIEIDELPGAFCVCVYYIEFDGEAWGAVSRCTRIASFEGERDITTLPVFPLRFKTGYDEVIKKAVIDGKAVVNLIEDRYGFYSGWSLTTGPSGGGFDDARGRAIRSPTHIESDVLVDFSEAFNTYPPWRPFLYNGRVPASGSTGSIGWRKSSPNVEWTDTHKTSAELQTRGIVVEWDGVDSVRASEYWSRDEYLQDKRVKMPSEEDFALIPRRFYGYSVWERKFFHLDIRSLQPKETTDSGQAFSQLQIESDDKQLIQSLVQSHFHKKSFQAKHGVEIQGQDLIRGKGKGLVILLHGVPGVGKTATAEAVAQKWQKPLFPITCGDLGITSEKVEKALNEIFRLAHLWDCVLLLDEADVFITQRVKVGDLQRNGLVSGKSRSPNIPETSKKNSVLTNIVLTLSISLPPDARVLQRNTVPDHKQTRSSR